MKRIRVIPVIMLDGSRAVVTRKFKDPVYVGDPINSIKLLNDKEVDELLIVDITSKKKRQVPDFDLIEKMASESFMPLAYGGHVQSVDAAERIIKSGIEKISFNTSLFEHPKVVRALADRIGSQSVVGSLDVKKDWLGRYVVVTRNGEKKVHQPVKDVLSQVLGLGVGEIFLNSVDRDGTRTGYDLELVKIVTDNVSVPVIACGGANAVGDFFNVVIASGASAVAAGAMFFFKGGFNSVLVNYPDQRELSSNLYSKL